MGQRKQTGDRRQRLISQCMGKKAKIILSEERQELQASLKHGNNVTSLGRALEETRKGIEGQQSSVAACKDSVPCTVRSHNSEWSICAPPARTSSGPCQ